MSERKVVLIDGPERGRVIQSSAPCFVVPKAQPPRLPDPTGYPFDATFETIVYTIHRVNLFGRVIHVGSVDSSQPRNCDAFEALASNTAKDIAL